MLSVDLITHKPGEDSKFIRSIDVLTVDEGMATINAHLLPLIRHGCEIVPTVPNIYDSWDVVAGDQIVETVRLTRYNGERDRGH